MGPSVEGLEAIDIRWEEKRGYIYKLLKLVFPLTLLPLELGGHVLILVPQNRREGVELIYWNRGLTFMKCDVGWNTTLTVEIEACDSVGVDGQPSKVYMTCCVPGEDSATKKLQETSKYASRSNF